MRSDGFTLLELLVVIAIIGILAAIGIGAYFAWINSMRAEAAAAEVGRMFDRAKAKVRTSNAAVTLTITPSTNTISLKQGTTEVGSSKLDATISSVTCRPACATNQVTVVAPFGSFNSDVKVTLNYANKIRDVYGLGPTALVKIVRR